jgi:hypothetical protein
MDESSPRRIKETVLDIEHWSGSAMRESAPENLRQFIAWAQWLLDQIPPEHHDEANIEIDSVEGHEGEHHVEIRVFYYRPETADEVRMRLDGVTVQRDAKEKEERRLYERLRAKFAR